MSAFLFIFPVCNLCPLESADRLTVKNIHSDTEAIGLDIYATKECKNYTNIESVRGLIHVVRLKFSLSVPPVSECDSARMLQCGVSCNSVSLTNE